MNAASRKIEIDNYSKGLLIGLMSKAVTNDNDLNPDVITKLKEIKTLLQKV